MWSFCHSAWHFVLDKGLDVLRSDHSLCYMPSPIFAHILRSGLVGFFILFCLLLGEAAVFMRLEREQHLSYLDCVFWAVTTLTTVGYGNIVPKTRFARKRGNMHWYQKNDIQSDSGGRVFACFLVLHLFPIFLYSSAVFWEYMTSVIDKPIRRYSLFVNIEVCLWTPILQIFRNKLENHQVYRSQFLTPTCFNIFSHLFGCGRWRIQYSRRLDLWRSDFISSFHQYEALDCD